MNLENIRNYKPECEDYGIFEGCGTGIPFNRVTGDDTPEAASCC